MNIVDYKQFFGGIIIGMALRSTDILPVFIGSVMGYYIGINNFDIIGIMSGLADKILSIKNVKSDTDKTD